MDITKLPALWHKTSRLPFGKWLFSKLIGRYVPYSGSIGAVVEELNAGFASIIQPISLSYVHGYSLREGIRFIRRMTDKPVGMNALIEQSSKRYHQKMLAWVDIALEEGGAFFCHVIG